MAIQHFVFTKFKPGTSAADKQKAFETARTLITPEVIPGLKFFRCGPPMYPATAQGFEFAITAEFEDIKAYKGYQSHPEHIKLVKVLSGLTQGFRNPTSGFLYQIDTNITSKL